MFSRRQHCTCLRASTCTALKSRQSTLAKGLQPCSRCCRGSRSAAQKKVMKDLSRAVPSTVFLTSSGYGQKYHITGCQGLRSAGTLQPYSRHQLDKEGYDACSLCFPDKFLEKKSILPEEPSARLRAIVAQCSPRTLADDRPASAPRAQFYCTPTGKCYHATPDCRPGNLHRARKVEAFASRPNGRRPCKHCITG